MVTLLQHLDQPRSVCVEFHRWQQVQIAFEALIERGARSVYATGVHPVFSGPAIDRLNSSSIEKVIVTDTLALGEKAKSSPKVEQLSLAVLLGEAIRRIHEGASVSSLFV